MKSFFFFCPAPFHYICFSPLYAAFFPFLMERMILLFLWSKIERSPPPPQTQVTVRIWSVSFSVPKWQKGSLSHFLCRPSLLTFQGCSLLSLPSSVDLHLQAHSRICRALCVWRVGAPEGPPSSVFLCWRKCRVWRIWRARAQFLMLSCISV